MAIEVKLRCSECFNTRTAGLSAEQKELVCPVCGRRIQNLTQDELAEMDAVQKRQKLFAAISLVFFALAVAGVVMFASGAWHYKVEKHTLISPPDANMGFITGALVCGFISMIIGALASSKRFIVEF